MPTDIFDAVAEQKPAPDIFDQVAEKSPAPVAPSGWQSPSPKAAQAPGEVVDMTGTPSELPPDEGQIARKSELDKSQATPKRTRFGTFVGDIFDSVMRGLGGGFGTAMKGTATMRPPLEPDAATRLRAIQSSPLYQSGQALQRQASEIEPSAPSLLNQAAEMAGQFAPVIAAGPGAPLVMGHQAAGETLDAQYAKLKEAGTSDEDAAEQTLRTAAGTGLTQTALWSALPAPLKSVLSKATGLAGENAITQFLARRVAMATEGGTLGAATQLTRNLTTGEPLGQGVAPSAAGLAGLNLLLPSGMRREPITPEPKGEPNAIPVRKSEALPFSETPANRQEVGGGISPAEETPVSQGQGGQEAAADVPQKVVETPDDFTRYKELVEQFKAAPDAEKPAIQQAIEEIKNRNGGLPPKEPVSQLSLEENPTETVAPAEELPQAAVPTSDSHDATVASTDIVGMGGAVPAEFETSPQTATSIKNAQVDVERQKRGLPPVMEPARRSFGQVWDDAMAIIDRDPAAQDDLIDKLRERPRALTDTEDAMLLHRQIDLQNEFGRASRDLAQAYEDGRDDAVAEGKLRMARLNDQLQDIYDIGKKVGTETGRGLNARKMMAFEDFSLAQMTLAKRAAKGGAPLTEGEQAEIQKLHDKIAETQKAHDEYVAKTEQRLSEFEAQKAIAELVKDKPVEAVDPQVKSIVDRILAFQKKRADAAIIRLRERLKRTSAGLDPTILADLAEIGAYHITKGAVEFSRWSLDMLKELGDLGEQLKPNLKEIFDAASQQVDADVEKMAGPAKAKVKRVVKKMDAAERQTVAKEGIKEKIDAGQRGDISSLVQTLARTFVEQGIIQRDPLIDAVHKVLLEIDPTITRRDAMDAISGYGDFKQLSQDAISQKLRDLKGQMQQMAKLEDIQARKPILKTGVERRNVSDEERRLLQQVNEAKRRFGVVVSDPAKQLKSALDAIKTNLRNRISDLNFQIASGKKIIRTRTGVPYDAEALKLKAERDALKERYQDIFGKPHMTDEQRVKVATNALEKSIKEYERRVKENDLSPRAKGTPAPSTPALVALKAQRDAIKKQYEELQELANPKKTPEQISLKALKTRLTNQTAELQAKLASGDFSKKTRRTIALDPEAQRLKAANEQAKLSYRRGLEADRLKNRSAFEKVQDAFVKWRRGAVLSGPVTLAKLTAAAVQRLAITPLEEGVGSALGKIMPGVASKAPRESGLSSRAEARSLTEGFTKGMADAWQTLKTGHSELDLLFGRQDLGPRSWIDFVGNIHGALKAPVKRAEFARAFEKRTEFAIRNGVDVTDPLVQTGLALAAYKDANRAIFLQDNRIVSAYKAGLGRLEAADKNSGKTPIAAKAGATALRLLLPIVKVPTNIVAETLQYSTGLVTGSVRLANAVRKGVDTLPPEQADLIMRELKKGSLGGALLLVGFLSPGIVGGYYQAGEKRDPKDVGPGRVRVAGVDIPSFLLHNPLLETLQIGATARRVADSRLRKKDANTQGVGVGIMAGAVGLIGEVPFIREMTQITKAFDPNERGAFWGELGKTIIVPQLVQWLARQTDKDSEGYIQNRKPTNAVQRIETGVPGLRQKVPINPKRPTEEPKPRSPAFRYQP